MAEKKGIILSRVSTEFQDYSPQTNELISYSKSLGYTEVKIIETKESGFIDYESKDGYKQVIDYIAENPQYNTVFVSEISRISRRKSVLSKIQEDFVNKKIQLYIKDKGYKLLNDDGTLNESTDILFTMYSYFAESEMRIKKERFQRSKKHLFAQGISITGKLLFGYNREKIEAINKNKLVVNAYQAEQISIIFNWYMDGIDNNKSRCSTKQITLECIARGFDKYTHSQRNVKKLLKEEAYTGKKRTNNDYEISYPLIIERDLFDAVQNKLKSKNVNAERLSKHITILSRIIKCPKCNGYLTPEYRIKDGYRSNIYYCANKKSIKRCSFKNSISMTVLDNAIWSYFYQFIGNNIAEDITKSKEEYTKEINEQIRNFENKKTSYIEQIKDEERIIRISLNSKNIDKDNTIKEYEIRINNIDNEIALLDNEIRNRKRIIENIKNNNERNYNIKEEIINNIDAIEKDKNLVKKYLRGMLTEIEIIYTDSKYTIIDVAFNLKLGNDIYDMGDVILIDKRDNHRIKIRQIPSGLDFNDNYFIFKGQKIPIEKFALKECFYDAAWMMHRDDIDYLFKSIREIEYRKLHFKE